MSDTTVKPALSAGFTREDARLLRAAADSLLGLAIRADENRQRVEETFAELAKSKYSPEPPSLGPWEPLTSSAQWAAGQLNDLADRIEALLPPEV
jgi:hypothetical protein